MILDLPKLKQIVQSYVSDPANRDELAENESQFVQLVGFGLMFLVALLMTVSIVYTKQGIALFGKLASSAANGELFDPTSVIRNAAEKIEPFVGAPVIIGQEGFGLILYSESKRAASQPDYLAGKAAKLAKLYSGAIQAKNQAQLNLFNLLRDDTYTPDRVRTVPVEFCDGEQLFLLDILLERSRITFNNKKLPLMLCAWLPDEKPRVDGKAKGVVLQLPWRVAIDAFKQPKTTQSTFAEPGMVDAELVEPEVVTCEVAHPIVKKSWKKKWTRLAVGFVASIAILVVGIQTIATVQSEKADEIVGMIRGNGDVQQELGRIKSCSYNVFASLTEGGRSTDVFNVQGTNGEGRLVAKERLYKIRSIVLITSNGEWELLD